MKVGVRPPKGISGTSLFPWVIGIYLQESFGAEIVLEVLEKVTLLLFGEGVLHLG